MTGAQIFKELIARTAAIRAALAENPAAEEGMLVDFIDETEGWDDSLPTFAPEEAMLPRYAKFRSVSNSHGHLRPARVTGPVTLGELSRKLWTACETAGDRSEERRRARKPRHELEIFRHGLGRTDDEDEDASSIVEILRSVFDHGFLLAGGLVCNLLQGIPIGDVDLDLFAPGMEPADAEKQFLALVADLKARELVGENTIIDRTLNCITAFSCEDTCRMYRMASIELQLICRAYTTVTQVLFSFDLAPSAVGWDGEKVYFTPEAAYAHATGAFVPDITKRRRSFEDRISKYVRDKGFWLVLPGVDLRRAGDEMRRAGDERPHADIVLPYLRLSGYFGEGSNRFDLTSIDNWRVGGLPEERAEERAEERRVYGALPYFDRDAITDHNIWRLLRGDNYLVWTRSDEKGPGPAGPAPSWRLAVPETFDEIARCVERLASTTSRGDSHSYVTRLQTVFDGDIADIGHVVFWRAKSQFAGDDRTEPTDGARAAIEKVAFRVQALAARMTGKVFVWKTSEQGTDLDSPGPAGNDEAIFKMEPASPAEWYGDWHRQPPARHEAP